MSRGRNIAATVVAVAVLAGAAFALANISLTLRSAPSYDFGAHYGGAQPATIQFHTFTMKPGEVVPWHFHKALSYVVLERGTLTETHVVDENSGSCASEQFQAGSGFVEQPGEVHTVTNSGDSVAVITWATAFPTSDGVHEHLPQFTLGGIYPAATVPTCH